MEETKIGKMKYPNRELIFLIIGLIFIYVGSSVMINAKYWIGLGLFVFILPGFICTLVFSIKLRRYFLERKKFYSVQKSDSMNNDYKLFKLKRGQIIGIFIVAIISVSSLVMTPYIRKGIQIESRRNYFLEFSEIVILRDKDFTDIYNFYGSGTETDPYRIENLLIISNKEVGIQIRDTESYFQIINCTIRVGTTCIAIGGVASYKATVRNCTLSVNDSHPPYVGFGIGISISSSIGVKIINNRCLGSLNETNWPADPMRIDSIGIRVRNSPFCRITDNNSTNWYIGVELENSDNTLVQNNNLSRNRLLGVYDEFSDYLIITSNICCNTTFGIQLDNSDYSIVSYNELNFNDYGLNSYFAYSSSFYRNNCSFNLLSGIIIHYGSPLISENTCNNNSYGLTCFYIWNCNISKNNFGNNSHYGMEIIESDYLFIYENNFINNCNNGSLIGQPQAAEYEANLSNNYWYDTANNIGNYWSDLIWDETAVYYIAGSNNTDLYPLENPVII